VEGAERYWTVDEARAYLPRLRVLLGVIRRAAHLAVSARTNGHATMPASGHGRTGPDGSSDGPEEPDVPVPPGHSARAGHPAQPADTSPDDEIAVAIDVEQAVQELEERGIVLRDADRGLIDFPARHPGGRDVLLCWQLGEDDLEWWHLPEDGFAGRRPLPLPEQL